MSYLTLARTLLSVMLSGVALPVTADYVENAGKIARATTQSHKWYVAQTAGTTPQTTRPTQKLADSIIELELGSKYGITGTELQILASELRSRLLTIETIRRYQIGAAAAQYAALSDAIYRDEALVDFDKDGKVDWRLDPKLNRRNEPTGFHGGVYVHTSGKEVVVAFEGTTPPDLNYLSTLGKFFLDLLSDVAGAALSDPQTVRAEALVIEAVSKYGKDHRIVVTGHSLGGRLAQIIAASRALEAYTFNPAAVSKPTQKILGPLDPNRVINILMVSDVVNPVSKLSTSESSRLGSNLGQRVDFYFPWSGFVREHSISTVAQRLLDVRRVYEDKIKPILADQQKPMPLTATAYALRPILTGPDVKPLAYPPAQLIQVDECLLYKCGERLKTRRKLTVFAAPDAGSPRLGSLALGTEFDPLTAAWVTTQPQVFKVRHRWAAQQNAAYWFEPGDLIYVYAYWGEGCVTAWTRGYLYGYFNEGHRPGGNDVYRKDLISCLSFDPNLPSVEEVQPWAYVVWIKLKVKDGRTGWITQEKDNLELVD